MIFTTALLIKIGLIVTGIFTTGYVIHTVVAAATLALVGIIKIAVLVGIGGGSLILYRKYKKYRAEEIAKMTEGIQSEGLPVFLDVVTQMAKDFAVVTGKAFHDAYIEVIEYLKKNGMVISEGQPKPPPKNLRRKAIELKPLKTVDEEMVTTGYMATKVQK